MIQNDIYISCVLDVYKVIENGDAEAAKTLAETINGLDTRVYDIRGLVMDAINNANEEANLKSEAAIVTLLQNINMIDSGALKAEIVKIRNAIANKTVTDQEVRNRVDSLGVIDGNDQDMRKYIIWLLKAAVNSNAHETIPYIREKLAELNVI